MLSNRELSINIDGCRLNNRSCQKRLYTAYYNFAMSICIKYVSSKEDALEIVNDGFLKVFKELIRYEAAFDDALASFGGWMKRIMINTAIDHFRKNQKLGLLDELTENYETLENSSETPLQKLSYDEILKLVHTLPPTYFLVFNLYVFDGFTHREIAEQLDIAEGTSKSNLARARIYLQKKLSDQLI